MVNALGVFGWGVGGIEAEAAMLGQAAPMRIPEVIGVRLGGALPAGVTAADLVLTVTQILRRRGVVGKFVEFFGPGLDHVPLADRAASANLAPEYGATCGYFPIDRETLRYLAITGREAEHLALVEAYARAQGLWRDEGTPEPLYSDTVAVDLGSIEPCLAGPWRPQDRVPLAQVPASLGPLLAGAPREVEVVGAGRRLRDGDVVIAAITSCTHTANPAEMVAAGLLARAAVRRGLRVAPQVKRSLAPGSRAVTEYLSAAGLLGDPEALGFHVVGHGCTTCIGNSGPLPEALARAVDLGGLTVCAVLSGNRNFEGRIHPLVRCRIDTAAEVEVWRAGGILPRVMASDWG
jgi:aconitate hydratase